MQQIDTSDFLKLTFLCQLPNEFKQKDFSDPPQPLTIKKTETKAFLAFRNNNFLSFPNETCQFLYVNKTKKHYLHLQARNY